MQVNIRFKSKIDEDQGSSSGSPTGPRPKDALQGLGGPMTRKRAKKAKENLDKEVNHFLSLKPIPEEEALKMVQMNQVDEGPNVRAGFLLRNFI